MWHCLWLWMWSDVLFEHLFLEARPKWNKYSCNGTPHIMRDGGLEAHLWDGSPNIVPYNLQAVRFPPKSLQLLVVERNYLLLSFFFFLSKQCWVGFFPPLFFGKLFFARSKYRCWIYLGWLWSKSPQASLLCHQALFLSTFILPMWLSPLLFKEICTCVCVCVFPSCAASLPSSLSVT